MGETILSGFDQSTLLVEVGLTEPLPALVGSLTIWLPPSGHVVEDVKLAEVPP